MNSPSGREEGFYRSLDSPTLVARDNSAEANLSPAERAAMEEEWRTELARLEGEIATLRSVLNTKIRQANELKRRLGLTPLAEIKRDFHQGVQTIKESQSYQKTNEKIHQFGETIAASEAYQKTNSALKSFGSYASQKLGDIRNSNMFKSVEGKVGDAYGSMKSTLSSYSMTRSASTTNNLPTSPGIDSLLDDDEVYTSGATSGHAGTK